MLKDKFGRDINYLRLAVVDRCNLRCTYCMPENGLSWIKQKELMINLWMEHIYGNSALVNTNNLAFRFHMLVDKYYKSQKNVAFYADELCITSNYLGVLCRKQYKKSPSAFIKERVLLEAKQMLHSSDKSIKEIAFELGFRNFSHFSYFFRTEAGTTPKNYRLEMNKMK